MKSACFCVIALMLCNIASASDRIYLVGKRQLTNSTHTHVVLFYDKEITDISDCEREIQRGYRGQWRHYHHKFPKIAGSSETLNYYCIKSDIGVDGWYTKAHYDYMYQFDLRSGKTKIKEMDDYAKCLRDLRKHIRDESPRFFCAKLSQRIRF